jgi:hypothetical protein
MLAPPLQPLAASASPRAHTPWAPALALSVSLWVAVFAATWPAGLSFADEVGYVGQAKLLLRGQLVPGPWDPGMWVYGPSGPVSRYPLTLPLLIAPWLALTPRAAFALGLMAAVAMTYCASRILQSWGRSPTWAILLLAHPTVVIVSRTIMADLVFSACTIAAWLALRRSHPLLCAISFALLCCIKPTGGVVAAALLVGEAIRMQASATCDLRRACMTLAPAALGGALGLLALLGMNLLTTGSWHFGYTLAQAADVPAFSVRYLGHNLGSYAPALLLSPPLLALGAWPLWQRRELGALCAIAALGGLMSGYFFVDWGRTWLESLVLAPRLLLPVVSILLVGYADLIAGLAQRCDRRDRSWQLERRLQHIACALAVSSALGISLVHRRWQQPMVHALASASQLADRDGSRRLALTQHALKQGLLYAGKTLLFDAAARNAPVVLCSTTTASHRLAQEHIRCDYRGYHVAAAGAGYEILVRSSSD